ncbi:MAG: hypothetical protein CMJ83_16195 [Planctomycetes bacterium]|nr:hypothetical protein [Planctomycetota bacterium]
MDRHPFARGVLAALCALLATAVTVAQSGEYLRQQRTLQNAMKKPDVSTRITAVETFSNCKEPVAIKTLLSYLKDTEKDLGKVRKKYEKVGRELQTRLAKVTNVPLTSTVQKELADLQPLRRELEKLSEEIGGHEKLSAALMTGARTVITSVPSDLKTRAIQELVNVYDWASKPEEKALALKTMGGLDESMIVTTLIGAAKLGRNPGVRVAALEAMTKAPTEKMEAVAVESLQDDFWQVKSAALALLREVGGKDVVTPLIDALEKAEGRLVDEILSTLKTLTKHNHHDNVALWRDWWKLNAKNFSGRGKNAKVESVVVKGGGAGNGNGKGGGSGTYFYGIQTRSKHIIYVLDISGSMRWTLATRYREGRGAGGLPPDAPKGKAKLDSAIKELISSITSLPENGTFNIITYSIEHRVWKKKMQKASKRNKTAARRWAESLRADGATNIFDALESSFKLVGRGSFDKRYGLAADTIFFLSDGQANRGRVVDSADMLREIRKLNDLKRVQVHCVGLGNSTDESFMRKLAEENDGQFVHVRAGR